jgi:hypothetical protein
MVPRGNRGKYLLSGCRADQRLEAGSGFYGLPGLADIDLSGPIFIEDAAPRAIANPMKAYRLYKWGQTKRNGRPIRNDGMEKIYLTPEEAVRKGLGFQPKKLSEGYRRW